MIVVRIYEGLGNQMFEYAYAYALSKRRRYAKKVYIDMRDAAISEFDRERIYRPLDISQFQISLPIASPDILKKWSYIENKTFIHKIIGRLARKGYWKYRVLNETDYSIETNYNYDKRYRNLKNNLYITGWFQHYEYFESMRADLLREFTLKQEFIIPQELQRIMEEHQVVSLHIRRGDYISNHAVRKTMGICNAEYYRKAVTYIKEHVENAFLFIFTNDEKWVHDHLNVELPYMIISNHYNLTDIQEMILMSKCRHNIIANSTFSWWGAWLNTNKDKIVIAPQRWFADAKRKCIAKKEWIQL